MVVIILMFGPPGCGKGTQACEIVGLTKITAISTGDMLRGEMKAGTELGRKAQDIMAAGGLVGDDLVNDMFVSRIERSDCQQGFLLDGYPRTVEQAKFLDQVLSRRGYPAPIVLHLDVPAEVVVGRITARRQCPVCGHIYNALYQPPKVEGICDFDSGVLFTRKDDTQETVRERLHAYAELTDPVIAHYQNGAYYKFDGTQAPEKVFEEIAATLESQSVAHAA
jgi:adenylate kinase